MTQPKIGFIGYGKHARANLYSSLNALGYSVSAVATTHQESVELAKLEQRIPNGYINHVEMLEKENLDCVFISAKPEQQIQLVTDALHAGVHVFVEKNLGFNAIEAQSIATLSKAKNKHVMVGFMKRFAPAYAKTKAISNSPEFGTLISLSQIFTSRNFVSNSAEYLLFAAIHYIDLLRFYLGEIDAVHAFETIEGATLSQTIACKSIEGKTASLYYCASPAWDRHVEEVCITGTGGYIKVDTVGRYRFSTVQNHEQTPRWQTVDEHETIVEVMDTTGSGGQKDLYLRGFVGEVKHFIESISNNVAPITDAHDNVKTMALYDKIVAALKQ